ncbi:MAG: hypothetical protein H7232_03690 [Aeromicrobium sp.]|nr:hypothetical protein [Burkholderiales bacterium]
MNASIKVFGFLCAVILSLPGSVHAATKNVIYINGIQNTIEAAAESLAAMQDRLEKSTNRVAGKKKAFSVSAIWNPIGWNGTKDGSDFSQDKMELFLEKTAEEKVSLDFQRIIAPYNQSREIDKAAAARVVAYLDDMTPGDNSLEADGKITDANMARSQQAVRNLVARVLIRQPAVVVAHSQGNLLANLAYAKIAADYGNDVYKIVRVVNIANNSEFSVSGLNLTHAKDLALFSAVGLETLPSQGSNWNRTTPRCSNSACNFLLAAPTFGGVFGTGGVLDHAFVETYLSSVNLPVVLNDQGVSFTQGATRFVDRFEDLLYTAAESLDLSLRTEPILPALFDTFDGTDIDTTKWTRVVHPTYSGTSASVSGGELRLAVGAYLHTAGKVSFAGRKIVVEALMGDQDVSLLLVDGAELSTGYSANVILGGDTTYRGWGLDVQTTGKYAIIGPTTAGSITVAEGTNVLISGVHNPALLYHRLTVDKDVVTYERGLDAGSLTERLSTKLASSIDGRPTSLLLRSGVGPYSPGRIQWVRVTTTP